MLGQQVGGLFLGSLFLLFIDLHCRGIIGIGGIIRRTWFRGYSGHFLHLPVFERLAFDPVFGHMLYGLIMVVASVTVFAKDEFRILREQFSAFSLDEFAVFGFETFPVCTPSASRGKHIVGICVVLACGARRSVEAIPGQIVRIMGVHHPLELLYGVFPPPFLVFEAVFADRLLQIFPVSCQLHGEAQCNRVFAQEFFCIGDQFVEFHPVVDILLALTEACGHGGGIPAEGLHGGFVGFGLVERRHLLALNILREREVEDRPFVRGGGIDDCFDFGLAEQLHGTVAAFAADNDVAVLFCGSHPDGLNKAVCGNGGGQFREGVFIVTPPRIVGIGADFVNGEQNGRLRALGGGCGRGVGFVRFHGVMILRLF